MLVTETFHGFIESTQDVLLIFEGCRRGLLPRICRRLQEKERKMIQSGSVFVFDERESGIPWVWMKKKKGCCVCDIRGCATNAEMQVSNAGLMVAYGVHLVS